MSDEEYNPIAYSRTLNEAIQRMHRARSLFLRQRIKEGGVSHDTLTDFEESIVTMYYELRPHAATDRRTKETWIESNVDVIVQQCGEVVEQPTEFTGGGVVQQKHEATVNHLDGGVLLELSRIFDEMAHELGFGAPTTSEPHEDNPGLGDLRGLLLDRGQTEAAEQLPNLRGDDRDEDETADEGEDGDS